MQILPILKELYVAVKEKCIIYIDKGLDIFNEHLFIWLFATLLVIEYSAILEKIAFIAIICLQIYTYNRRLKQKVTEPVDKTK